MQNNESNNPFLKFWKSKGAYMVLGLCAVAAIVAGYVFVSEAGREQAALEESLSAPVTATLPEEDTVTAPVEAPAEQQTETSAETGAQTPVSLPVEDTVMPVSGSVVQDYAMDRLVYNATTRDWRVHNGVDLSAPVGQDVRAARGGTVTAVYEDDAYGVTVVVSHGDTWVSRYCGLAEGPAVAAGDTVTAGQVLGAVGNTATVEKDQSPHLHFEVYHNGEPADPAGFLY